MLHPAMHASLLSCLHPEAQARWIVPASPPSLWPCAAPCAPSSFLFPFCCYFAPALPFRLCVTEVVIIQYRVRAAPPWGNVALQPVRRQTH